MNRLKTQVSVDQGVLRVTLNDPERLNPMSAEMNAEILAALVQADEDQDVRAVLVTGTGRGFSAGADLKEPGLSDARVDLGQIIYERYNPIGEKLINMRKPIVCAVNGVAAGAGANFALCCDIVLAARSAIFLQAFTRIGLLPDMAGTYMLPRLVGSARALGLAMLAEKLTAEEAAQWGLIWRCVDDDKLIPEAQAVAQKLAAMPPMALQMTKQALRASWSNTFVGQVTLERDLQRTLGFTDDFAEGAKAFLEKRKPVFKGS